MSVNNLDQRVTLQQLSSGVDAIGQPSATWVDVATLWANIIYQSGFEMIKADSMRSKLRAIVRIRKRSVDTSMRVISGGQSFNITGVIPDPDGKYYLDLICEASE